MKKQNDKIKILINLKKATGSISKITDMVEDNEYCIDIMQQNLAVLGLLKSVHQMLLQGHLDNCFRKAMSAKNEKRKQEMVDEILKVTKICNRCAK